jgi:hypothetical protein
MQTPRHTNTTDYARAARTNHSEQQRQDAVENTGHLPRETSSTSQSHGIKNNLHTYQHKNKLFIPWDNTPAVHLKYQCNTRAVTPVWLFRQRLVYGNNTQCLTLPHFSGAVILLLRRLRSFCFQRRTTLHNITYLITVAVKQPTDSLHGAEYFLRTQ